MATNPRGKTPTGVCTRCGQEKPRAAFGERADGKRKRVCTECLEREVAEFEARRVRNRRRVVDGREEKFCARCERWLPADDEHFYRERRPSRARRRGQFVAPCIECKLRDQAEYRARKAGDPAYEEARRQHRRRWEERHPEQAAQGKADWRRRAMQNPAYRRRRNEAQRMAYRLRRMREGFEVRPVDRIPHGEGGGLLPVAPLSAFIDARIAAQRPRLNGHATEFVCDQLGVAERQIRAWRLEREHVQFDIVDRVLLAADVHWWDVFDPDRWPEAAADAERLFEGAS